MVVEPVLVAFVGAVHAAIPDDHLAGAVLARGDDPLERGVVVRMVLRLRREPLLARIQRRPLRYGPGPQDPVTLEPQVVMHASGRMLLDHEDERPLPLAHRPRRGLGGGVEATLG